MTVGLPPPYALGLPPQFQTWRPDQEYALDLILNAPTRFVALTMPTGAGKSLVYMAGAHLYGGRSVTLTANKILMGQVGADYGSMGLIDIRGQSSYPCHALNGDGEWAFLRTPDDGHGDLMCDKGPCHVGLKCTLKTAGCAAYDRIRLATQSPWSVRTMPCGSHRPVTGRVWGRSTCWSGTRRTPRRMSSPGR